MDFVLENRQSLPLATVQCQIPPKSTRVLVNSRYEMVLDVTGTVFLEATDMNSLVGNNCDTLNAISSDRVFTFYSGYNNGTVNQSLSSLLDRPEIQTAKKIYASLQD